MNKNYKRYLRTPIRLCLTILCMFTLSLSAWAAENDEDTAAEQSRVITCGTGESADSADTSEPVAERVAPGSLPGAHSSTNGKKGTSLGMFTTTGYCNCSECSGDHKLTYSGTVPQAAHTISADLSIYPIGTKLMIDDVIYTVEDMGSHVNGNWIDIYYDNHDAAEAHGMKTQEVFSVIE